MFYGSQIFRFIGVFVAFVLYRIAAVLLNRKRLSFSEVWKGPEYDDLADGAMYEMKCIFFGAVLLFVICRLIIKFGF